MQLIIELFGCKNPHFIEKRFVIDRYVSTILVSAFNPFFFGFYVHT